MSMRAELIDLRGCLNQLFQGIAQMPAIEIAGLSSDSRKLDKEHLFLAVQGATSHGLDFLRQVEAVGAAAVVFDSSTGATPESSLPVIGVEGLAGYLGEIANRWYGSPSKQMRVTGVTGTNGKTTVAYLAAQCLMRLGRKCGFVGTLGAGVDEITGEGGMTTPACLDLHEILAGFCNQGVGDAVIEVSSHALEQGRVDGVHFDSAIFTNLSRDHIDYHGSMDAYFESKASLFLDHDVCHRIVSLDNEYGVELADRCGANVVTVSTQLDRVANDRPHIFVRSLVAGEAGSNVGIRSSWGDTELRVSLPGVFNVANAMGVLALLLCNDIALDDACATIEQVTAPPGRMERVNRSVDDGLPLVYVDYSHTPASLEAALKALRLHCKGQLWCVFGCGGDRDRGKRPMMGAVAEHLSDVAIVTSDNPRSEPPKQIIEEILEGMSDAAISLGDRVEAISHAVRSASADDIVLIAGKGHENYQVFGSKILPFSDYEEAGKALFGRGAGGS